MTELKFNLLDEPWIIVTNLQGKEETLSLTEVLVRSHGLKSLSGEMPSQDVAILRLLLGVMYAIYTRTEEYKNAKGKNCLEIWKNIWDGGCFSEDIIKDYFEQWKDRFDLLDPERPFYQIAGLDDGTHAGIERMIGDADRFFQSRNINNEVSIMYPEAARWLLYLNAYDTITMAPNRRKNLRVGLLGQLNIVYALGESLFETLMLNFRLYQHNKKPWRSGQAAWELDVPRMGDRTEIPLPESGEELFTLQSRRICLKHKDGMVFGAVVYGGDYFDPINAFAEPMTTWKFDEETSSYSYDMPYDKAASKQMWRDFASFFVQSDKEKLPGVVEWVSELASKNLIPKSYVTFSNLIMRYRKGSLVTDIWSDSLSVNANLLSRLEDGEEGWIIRITNIVELTEELVKILGSLASNLDIAAGSSEGNHSRTIAKEQAYAALDMPFRNWLADIDPKKDDMDDTCKTWVDVARKIILKHGENLVAEAGTQAFIGRNAKNPISKKEEYYSAPKVYGWFEGSISKKLKDEGYGKVGV